MAMFIDALQFTLRIDLCTQLRTSVESDVLTDVSGP